MAKNQKAEIGPLERAFFLEQYHTLCGKFYKYQVDQDLFEARKSVLSFVRGLRFSAVLIYSIRKILDNTKCTADWGAIIDDAGKKCSPECDIIVHENGSEYAWNGDDDVGGRVMDFHFVKKQNVKLVVSCKGFEVTQIDQNMKNDIVKLGDYVENVWLFAECCQYGQVAKLRRDARNAGYKGFFYLYRLKKSGGPRKYDERRWCRFVKTLQQLAAE